MGGGRLDAPPTPHARPRKFRSTGPARVKEKESGMSLRSPEGRSRAADQLAVTGGLRYQSA